MYAVGYVNENESAEKKILFSSAGNCFVLPWLCCANCEQLQATVRDWTYIQLLRCVTHIHTELSTNRLTSHQFS